MIKFMIKGVIFLMGLQSLFGSLQKNGIIEGSIRVNYKNIQRSVVAVLQSNEFNNVIDKLNDANIERYITPPEVQAEEYKGYELRRNENVWRTPTNAQVNANEQYQRPTVRYANAVQDDHEYDFNNLKNKTIRCYHHVVQNGETLEDLSNMYGVAYQVIMKVNKMYDTEDVHAGQNVYIPTRMA